MKDFFQAIQTSGDVDVQCLINIVQSGSSTTDIQNVVIHLLAENHSHPPETWFGQMVLWLVKELMALWCWLIFFVSNGYKIVKEGS